MSEAMIVPPLTDGPAKRTPTVYFIDDSATMREVIKIAFRRENFNVIACADAASALAQFEQNPPDVVITDVIMPDTGRLLGLHPSQAARTIRPHPRRADVRRRQQDRRRQSRLRQSRRTDPQAVSAARTHRPREKPAHSEIASRFFSDRHSTHSAPSAPNALTSLFAPPPTLVQSLPPNSLPPAPPEQRAADSAWPRALADAFTPHPGSPASGLQPAIKPRWPPGHGAQSPFATAKSPVRQRRRH